MRIKKFGVGQLAEVTRWRGREKRNHSIGLTLTVNNQSGLPMQISPFIVRA